MSIRATLVTAALAVFATGSFAIAQSSSSASAETASGSSGDQQFLTQAIEGDNSEMALGGLAMGRGTTVAVRDFGYTLVTDHRKAKVGAEDLAAKHGTEVPTDLTPEAQSELQKLLGLTGTAFDREFASYMVQDHTKDISDFKDEANNKGDVGSYAQKTLPTLEKHLKIAQSLESTTSANGSSSEEMGGTASNMSSSSVAGTGSASSLNGNAASSTVPTASSAM